ncbi:MAG: DnaJ domain-containing protein [Burkholderiales bacterium]
MATKRTLYEVLQVPRTASEETIRSAYELRLRGLGASAAPEIVTERTMVREAHAVLCDPARRGLYDENLLSAGSPIPRALEGATDSSSGWWKIVVVLLAVVAIGGTWKHLNDRRLTRLAEETRAEEKRRLDVEAAEREKEEAAQRQRETRESMERESERRQRESEIRRWEAQREYERTASRYRAPDYRRQWADEERRQELERERREQESVYRSQLEVERQKRYLEELERERYYSR